MVIKLLYSFSQVENSSVVINYPHKLEEHVGGIYQWPKWERYSDRLNNSEGNSEISLL